MRFSTASVRYHSRLLWPLLPAPLLNGATLALRPALTRIDRTRYADLMAAAQDFTLHSSRQRNPRLLRADLIEDKLRGDVIGAVAVVRVGNRVRSFLHLLAMRDTEIVRSEVLHLLRACLGQVVCGDDDKLESAYSATPFAARKTLSVQCAAELGVPENYASERGLSWINEPERLHFSGRDYVGRTLWLEHGTVHAWLSMQRSAAEMGVPLEAISGFRSIAYQAGILRRKRDRGMPIEEILSINTAPGYSEHHSGRAIDIGTPGCPPAEEVFETTAAFAWLRQHAAQFGFRMSYPRDNPHGVIYEPWHYLHV